MPKLHIKPAFVVWGVTLVTTIILLNYEFGKVGSSACGQVSRRVSDDARAILGGLLRGGRPFSLSTFLCPNRLTT